jgi:hemolysin activation/secretion protein
LSTSNIVEDPFDILDISSYSNLYEITLRQPIVETLTNEVALGLTASYQTSQTFLGIDDIGPFPLSPGADSQGRTTISALRFFQQWTQRSSEQVLAFNSQFNLGLGVLGATVNESGPDSRFLSWRGQGQWVRKLGPDTLLILRGSTQLSTDSLLTSEKLGIGGQYTVRGYRQDQLLTDNGLLASAEVRFPIFQNRNRDMQLQLTPFIDAGYGWNTSGFTPTNNTLIGIGTGLLFTMPNLSARLDWGIPLKSVEGSRNTLQENGIYFTFTYSIF